MKGELTLGVAINLAKKRSLVDPETAQVLCLDRDFPGYYLVCNETEYIHTPDLEEKDIVAFFLNGKRIIP